MPRPDSLTRHPTLDHRDMFLLPADGPWGKCRQNVTAGCLKQDRDFAAQPSSVGKCLCRVQMTAESDLTRIHFRRLMSMMKHMAPDPPMVMQRRMLESPVVISSNQNQFRN